MPPLLRAVVAAFALVLMPRGTVAARAVPPTNEQRALSCVAIGLPSVQGVTGSATEVASGLRDLMTSYLSGPSLKVMALDARLPAQAAEEAKQKDCGTLLVLSLTRKSGGGGLGHVFGEVAGTSSRYLPGGSAVTAAASTGLRVASSLASSTKPKDELRLDYRL